MFWINFLTFTSFLQNLCSECNVDLFSDVIWPVWEPISNGSTVTLWFLMSVTICWYFSIFNLWAMGILVWDFPLKNKTLPKNFCSSSAMDGTLYPSMSKWMIYGFPLLIEKLLHFDGFNFIPIDLISWEISLIILWWVLLSVVNKQKSSA